MSLLSPTPGEILDRLSILELKICAFAKKGSRDQLAELEAEKAGLEERMKEWEDGLTEEMTSEATMPLVNKYRTALTAANSLLWAAEDEVRALPRDDAFRLAGLCKHIAATNDARSRHIAELNGLFGLKTNSDKIYRVRKNAVTEY